MQYEKGAFSARKSGFAALDRDALPQIFYKSRKCHSLAFFCCLKLGLPKFAQS